MVIPMLQRDYAQGRCKDPETEEIRRAFAEALNATLVSEADQFLDLGLVFGAENKGRLTLLDGQQRLTTLFLLHWYLAKRTAQTPWPTRFQNFSYETRVTARDFCRALAVKDVEIDEAIDPSQQIRDMHWFRLSWEKDPTVQGMLVMLDALHKEIQKEVPDKPDPLILWQRLTTKPRVHFQFLPHGEFGSPEELYLKLNARGMVLNEFEKFKAWLEKHVKQGRFSIEQAKWDEKLDTVWTDLFWSHRDKEAKDQDIGNAMLAFFRGTALHAILALEKGATNPRDELIRKVTANKQHFLTDNDLKSLFSEVSINDSFKIIEVLTGRGYARILSLMRESQADAFHKKASLFEKLISGWQKLGLVERLIFHALCCYLKMQPDPLSDDHSRALARWMRVARNVIVNSTIGTEQFANAVETIHKLAYEGCQDIDAWLIMHSKPGFVGLNQHQLEEEHLKAKLRKKNSDWVEVLNDAEDHLFFQGQIGFLLEFAKDGEDYGIDKFKQHAQRARELFNDNAQAMPFLLHRALLAQGNQGDYLVHSGLSYSFGKDRSEWRTIFQEHPEPLRMLLEALETHGIQDIIDHAIEHPLGDWRDHFINCPEALEFCKSRRIRCWDAPGDPVLLVHRDKLGPHAELRSYCFFIKHLKDKNQAWHPFTTGYQHWGRFDAHAYLEHTSPRCRIEIRHPQVSQLECHYQVRILSSDSSIAANLHDGWDSPSATEQLPSWQTTSVKWFKDEHSTLDELRQIISVISSYLQHPSAASSEQSLL